MKKFVLCLVLMMSTLVAGEDIEKLYPLGLKMGMTKTQVEKVLGFELSHEKDSEYENMMVPEGKLPLDCDKFKCGIDPQEGLCFFTFYSKRVYTNGFGTQLKEVHDELIDIVTTKYGKMSFNVDILREGSIWRNPEYWAMSILKQERMFLQQWLQDNAEIRKMMSENKNPDIIITPCSKLNLVKVSHIKVSRLLFQNDTLPRRDTLDFYGTVGLVIVFENAYKVAEREEKEKVRF